MSRAKLRTREGWRALDRIGLFGTAALAIALVVIWPRTTIPNPVTALLDRLDTGTRIADGGGASEPPAQDAGPLADAGRTVSGQVGAGTTPSGPAAVTGSERDVTSQTGPGVADAPASAAGGADATAPTGSGPAAAAGSADAAGNQTSTGTTDPVSGEARDTGESLLARAREALTEARTGEPATGSGAAGGEGVPAPDERVTPARDARTPSAESAAERGAPAEATGAEAPPADPADSAASSVGSSAPSVGSDTTPTTAETGASSGEATAETAAETSAGTATETSAGTATETATESATGTATETATAPATGSTSETAGTPASEPAATETASAAVTGETDAGPAGTPAAGTARAEAEPAPAADAGPGVSSTEAGGPEATQLAMASPDARGTPSGTTRSTADSPGDGARPATSQPAEPRVTLDCDDLNTGVDLRFASGGSGLGARDQALLQAIARCARRAGLTLEIGGHTDSEGDSVGNLLLSVQRAELVADQLDRLGIPAERLLPRGYGESQPRADNFTATGRALNRRVTVRSVPG